MRQAKQIRREMLIGLAVWMAVIGLLLTIIAANKFAAIAGVCVGTLGAVVLVLHMYRHLDIALDMDARHAQTHTQVAAFQRMLIMGGLLAVSMICPQYLHPIGMVLGLFGVKVTALLNPLIHRLLQRFQKKHTA